MNLETLLSQSIHWHPVNLGSLLSQFFLWLLLATVGLTFCYWRSKRLSLGTGLSRVVVSVVLGLATALWLFVGLNWMVG